MRDFNFNQKAIDVVNELDRFFGGLVNEDAFSRNSAILPVDISRGEKEYTIQADVPGFSEDEVSVEFKNGVVKIVAESSTTESPSEGATETDKSTDTQSNAGVGEKESSRSRQFRERVSYNKVERSIPLSKNIDEENISANLENGVLTVVAPIVPDPESRKIKVNQK